MSRLSDRNKTGSHSLNGPPWGTTMGRRDKEGASSRAPGNGKWAQVEHGQSLCSAHPDTKTAWTTLGRWTQKQKAADPSVGAARNPLLFSDSQDPCCAQLHTWPTGARLPSACPASLPVTISANNMIETARVPHDRRQPVTSHLHRTPTASPWIFRCGKASCVYGM
jgi:hypothetical protein